MQGSYFVHCLDNEGTAVGIDDILDIECDKITSLGLFWSS